MNDEPQTKGEPAGSKYEFVIRCSDAEFWPDVSTDALRPLTLPSTIVPSRDVHTILVGDAEISFSYEMPGWQVVFESGNCTLADARLIVDEVLGRLTAATGMRGRVLDLSGITTPIAFEPFRPEPGREANDGVRPSSIIYGIWTRLIGRRRSRGDSRP